MKKQLAILSALLAVNTTANAAFDLELKGGADIYTFASQKVELKGDTKEVFTGSYDLSQAVQNFGGVAQLNYNIMEGLYIGGGLGLFIDRAFTGKTDIAVSYFDKDGNDKTAEKLGSETGYKNKTLESYDLKTAKGGYINLPIFLSVKYDLPVALEAYAMNFYLIAKGGYNIPFSNEEVKESPDFSNTLLNFNYGLGFGGEFYGVQLEVLYNGLTANFSKAKSTPEDVEQFSFNTITQAQEQLTKSNFRHGFSLTAGYRLADLF
jgi:hypothetical protein